MGLCSILTLGDALFEDTDTNPWRYCGEYYDTETNTIYLRARYYDPVTGRFSSEDPIRDGLNWYTYCIGNPVLYIDFTGCNYEYSRVKNVGEFWLDSLSIGPQATFQANNIATKARNAGIEYAKNHDDYYVTKTWLGGTKKNYITWDNEADAYRHFTWNFSMSQEISDKAAKIVANNHEVMELIRVGAISGINMNYMMVAASLNRATLMDLWNNSVGQNLAGVSIFSDKSADEMFAYAMNNNLLITSLDDVHTKYGFDTSYLSSDGTVNVLWNILLNEVYIYAEGKNLITVKYNDTIKIK